MAKKEPWEMTQEEYKMDLRLYIENLYDKRQLPEMHKNEIKRAINKGKRIPPEVLAEYPELVQKENNQ